MTEIKFASNKRHTINVNDVQCVHPENERPATIVYTLDIWTTNSTAAQFVADHIPSAVQDLVQRVNVHLLYLRGDNSNTAAEANSLI